MRNELSVSGAPYDPDAQPIELFAEKYLKDGVATSRSGHAQQFPQTMFCAIIIIFLMAVCGALIDPQRTETDELSVLTSAWGTGP